MTKENTRNTQGDAGKETAMAGMKLICTDIDGTLVTEDHITIPAPNLEALNKAQEGGVRVALVSGRGVYSQSPFISRLRLDEYKGFLIAFTGARIVEADTKSEIFSLPIRIQDANGLYEFVRPLNLDVMLYDDAEGVMHATRDNEYTRFDQKVTGMEFRVLRNIDSRIGFTLYKCIIAGDTRRMDTCMPIIRDWFSYRFSITRSSGYFAEFNLSGATKGDAMALVSRRLGIGEDEVLAVGNGENDVSMLKRAGMSAAPADAMEEARRAAKYVCRRKNSEGALAEAIEHYFG